MNYNHYLQTKHWKDTRKKKLDRADHCQICDSTNNLQIHHKHYSLSKNSPFVKHQDRKSGSILFDEKPQDLLTLCASCHRLWHAHYGKAYPRHKTLSKIRRLINLGCMPIMAIKLSKEEYAYNVVLDSLKHINID